MTERRWVTTCRSLGEIDATVNGAAADLDHALQRSVLAALLVEPNRPVSTWVLTDRVWGDRVLSSAQSVRGDGGWHRRRGGGGPAG